VASPSLICGAGHVSGTLAIDQDAKKMWFVVGSTGAVGLEIAAYIGGVGHFGGGYLARRFEIPWLYWLAMFVGVACAINALVRVNRIYKKSLQKEDEQSPQDPPA
jgi:hypothetical protein